MINETNVRYYCCEDISTIENYKNAIEDPSQTWSCHHKKEIELRKTKQELIDMGLYYDRPASELIFLTHFEHQSLHQSYKYGIYSPMYGKHHNEESRRKMSESRKGERNHFYHKHHTEESKRKISESLSGFKHSLETREKMSKSKIGNTNSKNYIIKTYNEWYLERGLEIGKEYSIEDLNKIFGNEYYIQSDKRFERCKANMVLFSKISENLYKYIGLTSEEVLK